jgi:hypothetical protein
MDLQALQKTLFEDNLPAAFLPADEELDAARVNVALDVEGFSQPIVLQITQVETEVGALSGLELIQLFAPIPLELEEEAASEIVWALPAINEVVPLVGFNVHPEERFVYFRHVMLVPEGEVGRGVVVEAVWMAHFALDMWASEFAAAAA